MGSCITMLALFFFDKVQEVDLESKMEIKNFVSWVGGSRMQEVRVSLSKVLQNKFFSYDKFSQVPKKIYISSVYSNTTSCFKNKLIKEQ